MITFTITSGTPTVEELTALELALEQPERPVEEALKAKSVWATPQLRQPLPRKLGLVTSMKKRPFTKP